MLSGQTTGNSSKAKMLKILFPYAKHFTPQSPDPKFQKPDYARFELSDSEITDLTDEFISNSVKIGNRFKPPRFVQREIFNKLLSDHPYPVGQGPFVLQLDDSKQKGVNTFSNKTEF